MAQTDPVELNQGRSHLQIQGITLETQWLPGRQQTGLTWVLLHEGLGCIDLWRDFPAALQRRSGDAVFCWSRQGYGGSDSVPLPRPLDYMTQEATQSLAPLLAHVPGRHIALLGHSDGASIAALYAGLLKDPRLIGAVLVAPHFYTEQIALDAIAEAKTAYTDADLRVRLKKYHHNNVDCAFRGWNDAWLDPEFRLWDIRYCLPGIQVPLVLVQGESDKYGSVAQVNTAAELSGGDTVVKVISDCDHWPHVEAPDALLDAADQLKILAL